MESMKKTHRNFLSILDELSGGRNKTPWLQDAGLTKGTISRLINGDSPSLDILSALARTENASLHWLTEDRGSPYRVIRVASDAEGWLLLDELLQETGWALYQFANATGACCLVLTQPGEFEIKGRTVPYTIVEILAGEIGPKTRERFVQVAENGFQLYAAEISDDEFDRLGTGHMGNYELLGWRDAHGLIHTAIPGDSKALSTSAEKSSEYQQAITESESRLLKRFRELNPDAQQQLIQIAQTFKIE